MSSVYSATSKRTSNATASAQVSASAGGSTSFQASGRTVSGQSASGRTASFRTASAHASVQASGRTASGSSAVPVRIAEDLLQLLRNSAVSVAPVSASAASASASSSTEYLSQVELAILRSTKPIEVTETEEITVLGNRGLWTNKAEVMAWKGDLPIDQYLINEDNNPEIINRKISEEVEYVQELAIRYLRPPTPPAPGEIVITQEPNYATGPAPPLVIRQQPARPETPEPLIVREAPPQPPKPVGSKRITISGKRIPPPPRKVVIERLAPLPSKPQNVIIERWLPYGEVKRRVVFNKPTLPDPVVVTPRNIIVQWEAPDVNVSKEIKYLGVVRANPAEYVEKYGASLVSEMPQFVQEIATPADVGVLAADYKAKSLIELEGQLEGFQFVDLDKEGLSEYRAYLSNLGINDLGAAAAASAAQASSASESASASASAAASSASAAVNAASSAALKIFSMIDANNNGFISVAEAERIVLRLNSRLNRSYGENDVKAFFSSMVGDSDSITQEEFVSAFQRLVLA